MSLAWIAEVLFFACYALGYYFDKTIVHSGWGFVTAVAAAVIAVLLVLDNRAVLARRSNAAE